MFRLLAASLYSAKTRKTKDQRQKIIQLKSKDQRPKTYANNDPHVFSLNQQKPEDQRPKLLIVSPFAFGIWLLVFNQLKPERPTTKKQS